MARWLLDKLDQVEKLGGWVGYRLQAKQVPGDEIDLTAHSYGLTRLLIRWEEVRRAFLPTPYS